MTNTDKKNGRGNLTLLVSMAMLTAVAIAADIFFGSRTSAAF